MQRRVSAQSIRAAERREREAAAPKLATVIPSLVSLDIQFEEHISSTAASVMYVRRVVIAAASSLFEIKCGDSACQDGGHELSTVILPHLRNHETAFSGEDACHGSIGSAPCQRVLHFKATATYSD